jgi:hypothetical protein
VENNFFCKIGKVRVSTQFLLKTHGIMYIMKMGQREKKVKVGSAPILMHF